MTVFRKEKWGRVCYDTDAHEFYCEQDPASSEVPYVARPLVLNCDLTFRCNMSCRHCVARDMGRYATDDLRVTSSLLEKIKASPFMCVVVTGGEPLLPEYEPALLKLVRGTRGMGLMVDTNGTLLPSSKTIDLLVKHHALLRVSLDSLVPHDECELRQAKSKRETMKAYDRKMKHIERFRRLGLNLAVQSVLSKKNISSIMAVPRVLEEWGIGKLYVQRLIPTQALGNKFSLPTYKYERTLEELAAECSRRNVKCCAKLDRRHNSVYLLVGNGRVFTQGERPGQKVELGEIGKLKPDDYFQYVSASEHSTRYYGVLTGQFLAPSRGLRRAR